MTHDANDTDGSDSENHGGAPPGNDFAVGNSGGGAPENNQNAARHHLYSDPEKMLAYLEENEPEAHQWVQAKVSGYLDDASFAAGTAQAAQVAQIVAREYAIWVASGIQLREGILTKTHMKGADGTLVEVEREHPVNKPLDRMESQVTRRLKDLGLLDNPDSQTADASAAGGNEYYDIEIVEDEADGEPETEAGDDGA